MRNSSSLSYCAQLLREHRRDIFLQSLFLPKDVREAVLAMHALEWELDHARRVTTEPMIAQIRFAWWEEALAAMQAGGKPREHPVLQALAEYKVPLTKLGEMVAMHREAYPEPVSKNAAKIIVDEMISALPSTMQTGWARAGDTIIRHRKRFSNKLDGWLITKLLCSRFS